MENKKKRAIKGDVTARAKILYSNSLNEEYKWATYTGDKRALSYHVKSLIRKDARTAPSKGTMITELSNKISQKLKRELTAKLD